MSDAIKYALGMDFWGITHAHWLNPEQPKHITLCSSMNRITFVQPASFQPAFPTCLVCFEMIGHFR